MTFSKNFTSQVKTLIGVRFLNCITLPKVLIVLFSIKMEILRYVCKNSQEKTMPKSSDSTTFNDAVLLLWIHSFFTIGFFNTAAKKM